MEPMRFDVLPGPSLPERARTALARARTASVSDATSTDGPSAAGLVSVRATWDGSPLLLPPAGSPLASWLAGRPGAVRVSLPAGAPFSALRLTGTVTPVTAAATAGAGGNGGTGITGGTACVVSLGTVEFTGGGEPRVAVEAYRAARPDPLWRVAP